MSAAEAIAPQITTPRRSVLIVLHGAIGDVVRVAAAVGCPVESLWGLTAAERSAPWGFAGFAISGAIPCHPCYVRQCPIGRECMRRISPEGVSATLKRALAPGGVRR
jgi:hypothetical protein